ncbi:MAG TPA: inositol monophosphatase family protein [Nocardioidaceae bacterium]|nr:inositol monophosphatase family protein [Nocardioidaceae bacterium]
MPPESDGPSYAALVALAREVATEAAALVVERRRGTVTVAATKSSPVDVVTEADRASEDLIRRRLLDARPGDGFLGEEGDPVAAHARPGAAPGVTWVVDPIDGTVNFLYGLPHYSVSIAARVGESVVAGVVLDVTSGECFTATLGGGAFCDGEPIHVRAEVPLAERLVATGFNYRRELRAAQAQAMTYLLPRLRDIRRQGSAALDLCAVAAGRVDGYVEEGLFAWDLAAGGLVATEAGARLETPPGVGGGECVLCAPADGFDALAALVAESGLLWEQNPSAGR